MKIPSHATYVLTQMFNPTTRSLTSIISIKCLMLNQSSSPSSRVCMSWVPSLKFNECLYAESCNMSLSTSLPWHYSHCFSPLEFIMFQPVICSRMATDWRDSGWQEFTVAVPVQCSAETGFNVRSRVCVEGPVGAQCTDIFLTGQIFCFKSFIFVFILKLAAKLCIFSHSNDTKVNWYKRKLLKYQILVLGWCLLSCLWCWCCFFFGWGPERQHQMCLLSCLVLWCVWCLSCFDLSREMWIREPPQLWQIKG